METIHRIIIEINQSLSEYVLLFLLLGTGLWFSFKTRFVQLRYFKEGIKRFFSGFSEKKEKQENGMSSFQALATAIAAQVGTGNIVGASGAILTGGPGAIFWMWIIAFLGMATIYAEAVLAQKTRVRSAKGDILGGPVYYIIAAFKGKAGKLLAGFFAVAGVIAMGFLGAMVQANSIAETIHSAFGVPPWAVGILLVLLCGLIVMGGTRRLAGVMEIFVPVMAGVFLLGALAVLLMNITKLPTAIGLIFKYAFSPQAIIGGSFGAALKTALSQGAKRGLFSNEAGMGTTPHAHAQAMVDNPHQQGTVAIIGVFIDTFVVLTLNALVIITTLYTPGAPWRRAAFQKASAAPIFARPPSAPPSAMASVPFLWRYACSSLPFPPYWAGISSAKSTAATCLEIKALSSIKSWLCPLFFLAASAAAAWSGIFWICSIS